MKPTELAKILGVTRQTIYRFKKYGMPDDINSAINWLNKYREKKRQKPEVKSFSDKMRNDLTLIPKTGWLVIKCNLCGIEFIRENSLIRGGLKKFKNKKFYCSSSCFGKSKRTEKYEKTLNRQRNCCYINPPMKKWRKYPEAIPRGISKLKCEQCGNDFIRRNVELRNSLKRDKKAGVYCSLNCFYKSLTKKAEISITCSGCGSAFNILKGEYRSTIKKRGENYRFFCTNECFLQTRERERKERDKICKCGKLVEVIHSNGRRYCKECSQEQKKIWVECIKCGKKEKKGGMTPKRKREWICNECYPREEIAKLNLISNIGNSLLNTINQKGEISWKAMGKVQKDRLKRLGLKPSKTS